MEHIGYKKNEDGELYEIGRILTMEPWREDSIIESWEIAGWKHYETKEYRNGNLSQLQIYFIRPDKKGNEED